jgi:hypothetical protein
MGSDMQARFDALMCGDGLSTADRDDLRWLVTHADGVPQLTQAAASLALFGRDHPIQEQVQRV